MSTPQRIQRKRTKGWRMPEGAVYVGRPTKWGNPWKAGDPLSIYVPDEHGSWWANIQSPEHATLVHRAWFLGRPDMQRLAARELAGRDLACWCPLVDAQGNRVPCHADVLLELANR